MVTGQRIKNLRESQGWTQFDLAEKLNVKQPTINRYENGRVPEPGMLCKIADLFNVTTDYLLGRDVNNDDYTLAAHRTDNPMNDLPEAALKRVREIIEEYEASFQKDNKDKQP